MDVRDQLLELRQTWKAPWDLDHARPREVILTRSGKALVWLSIVLVTGALATTTGLSLLARRQAEVNRALQEKGVVTEGTITRLWRGSDDRKSPYVAYHFMCESGRYDREAKVPLATWRLLRVGSSIQIRYVPTRPELNRPEGSGNGILPPWVPFIVGGVLAFFSFLATVPLRGQRRLLAEGRPAPAVVTRHGKLERGQHGNKLGRRYFYEFLALSGARAQGKAGPVKDPPAVGRTISVIYDPEKPVRNAPYPLTLVKPAYGLSPADRQ
jgi:hypothetical protein